MTTHKESMAHIAPEDRLRMIAAAKEAAVFMAALWDVMRPFENDDTGDHFDGTVRMVEELAAAMSSPASVHDVADETVWQCIEDCWCQG